MTFSPETFAPPGQSQPCHLPNLNNSTMATQDCATPSVLEYARHHGLAFDHRAEDLENEISMLGDEGGRGAFDTADLLKFIPSEGDELLTEAKFQLNDRERALLAASIRPPAAPAWDSLLPNPHRIRDLKLEVPILSTDHEADMKTFSQKQSLDLEDLGISLATIDGDKDGLLCLPSEITDLAEQWDSEVAGEKLQATKDVLLWLQKTLRDPCKTEDITMSWHLLSKPEGLRVLDRWEDVDEKELTEEMFVQIPSLDSETPQKRLRTKRPPQSTSSLHFHDLQSPAIGRAFSASSSLSSFMETRGEKFTKRKVIGSHHFPAAATGADESSKQPSSLLQTPPTTSEVQVPETPVVPPSDLTTLPILEGFDLTTPRSTIVNCALLQTQRPLIKALESRFRSALTIVYRDLDLPHTGRASAKKPTAASAAASTPDMIFSPSAALIFTSLQATIQRSLPGHEPEQGLNRSPSHSPVHTRILHLAHDFDALFILATFSPSDSQQHLVDVTTAVTMSAFTDFCASLTSSPRQFSPTNAHVSVTFVPHHPSSASLPQSSSTSSALASAPLWEAACSLIAQHAFQPSSHSPPLEISHEETSSELLLRKVGLNPFAAQVLLGSLRELEPEGRVEAGRGSGSQTSECHIQAGLFEEMSAKRQEIGCEGGKEKLNVGRGVHILHGEDHRLEQLWVVRALKQMSARERMERFGPLLGTRVLDRLTQLKDRQGI